MAINDTEKAFVNNKGMEEKLKNVTN